MVVVDGNELCAGGGGFAGGERKRVVVIDDGGVNIKRALEWNKINKVLYYKIGK